MHRNIAEGIAFECKCKQQQIDEEEDFIFYIPYQSNNCNVSSLPTRGSENIHFGAMLAIQVLLSKGKELEALCLSSARPLNFHFLRSTESLALALVLIDSCLPPCLLCLSTPLEQPGATPGATPW